METIDLAEWVHNSPDSSQKSFRQAIHSLMLAISRSAILQPEMIFHGGLLLTLKFKGARHTKDIDFATSTHFNKFDVKSFLRQLQDSLVDSCEALPYGMDCRIQSHRVMPPGPNKNFQTLKVKMGYALKDSDDYRHLLRNNCKEMIEIDFSFNELNLQIDTVQLSDGGQVRVYSLPDLVAEKYRAIVQQKIRRRNRRQDAYDIYSLLEKGYLDREDSKILIFKSLIEKARSRDLLVAINSLRDSDVIARSSHEYETLADEIAGDLPPFDRVYGTVRDYYESLPWNSLIE